MFLQDWSGTISSKSKRWLLKHIKNDESVIKGFTLKTNFNHMVPEENSGFNFEKFNRFHLNLIK